MTNTSDILSHTNRTHMVMFNDTDALAKGLFKAKLSRVGYGYVLFVICFTGVCGNMLVFSVLTRKALRTSTVAVYLQVLALSDTCVLVTAFFRYKTYKVFMTDAADNDAAFHFDPYIEVYVEPLFWIFLGVSSFVTLLLSTERYLAVKYPLAMKRTCTVQLVSVCIAAVSLIVTVITVPVFFTYEIRPLTFKGINPVAAFPTEFGENERYYCTYQHYIIPLVWYVCPWSVLAVVNVMLTTHVHKSARIRVGVPSVSNPNRNLSLLIILVVVVYMVCNFPVCVMSLMQLAEKTNCLCETQALNSPYSNSYLVAKVVANILNVLNSCVNIIVYCFVGSKFRKELRKVVLCEPCHKHTTIHINNTIHVTVTHDTNDSVPSNSPPPTAHRQV